MRSIAVSDFDLAQTVQSAQPLAFFGERSADGKGVIYAFGDSLIEARQNGSRLEYASYGSLGAGGLEKEIGRRFGLGDDMGATYRKIGTDSFMKEAIKKYRGLRITRNGPWETTLCFVISQFNNVKRIRGIVKRLVAAYGEEQTQLYNGVRLRFSSFPTPEAIAGSSVRELMGHGAGFRARYIRALAEQCSGSFDLAKLDGKSYENAKDKLMELDGIGDKVADCILLFGYGRQEAFPIDTWIKRIMERVYFRGAKQKTRSIHEFAEERWGAYAGYAQQYLYEFARNEPGGGSRRK